MGSLRSHRVVAHNTATASTNKIHDDEVARRYGFRGGLVPGVDVYAYMTRLPAESWGLDWLRRGSMEARFLSPVYEGEAVDVVADDPVDDGAGPILALKVVDRAGTTCAVGRAGLPVAPGPAPAVAAAPGEAVADRPDASPEALAPGTALAVAAHRFLAGRAGEYLADVREDLALYATARVAHPGWVLRRANDVLASNVRLGPWIHVGSEVRHHAVVADGDTVDARATVTREWERKGHRFVELDVGVFSGGATLVARIVHTAIYRPRPASARRAGPGAPGGRGESRPLTAPPEPAT